MEAIYGRIFFYMWKPWMMLGVSQVRLEFVKRNKLSTYLDNNARIFGCEVPNWIKIDLLSPVLAWKELKCLKQILRLTQTKEKTTCIHWVEALVRDSHNLNGKREVLKSQIPKLAALFKVRLCMTRAPKKLHLRRKSCALFFSDRPFCLLA